ncbi:Double-strand break repair protein MRE11 [Acorus calamus]|uniref:Double-strand break repair protein MRE11 n=1 Tax=Acorus calamus TaxID=4465 RepID=A0AAV9FB02_ACOCL|nr:Double-strand break repair protein MRE11 [Acorus calamus]
MPTVDFDSRQTSFRVNLDSRQDVRLPDAGVADEDDLEEDNLSAIDILSTCNLVNYFRNMVLGGSGVGQIIVNPILIRKEVPGMGFHITQPRSSVATSLIDGEAKPKHVLLEIKHGTEYRPTKIALKSVRPFEYTESHKPN